MRRCCRKMGQRYGRKNLSRESAPCPRNWVMLLHPIVVVLPTGGVCVESAERCPRERLRVIPPICGDRCMIFRTPKGRAGCWEGPACQRNNQIYNACLHHITFGIGEKMAGPSGTTGHTVRRSKEGDSVLTLAEAIRGVCEAIRDCRFVRTDESTGALAAVWARSWRRRLAAAGRGGKRGADGPRIGGGLWP